MCSWPALSLQASRKHTTLVLKPSSQKIAACRPCERILGGLGKRGAVEGHDVWVEVGDDLLVGRFLHVQQRSGASEGLDLVHRKQRHEALGVAGATAERPEGLCLVDLDRFDVETVGDSDRYRMRRLDVPPVQLKFFEVLVGDALAIAQTCYLGTAESRSSRSCSISARTRGLTHCAMARLSRTSWSCQSEPSWGQQMASCRILRLATA